MLKGAIFDFDGTIVDSMYIWENIAADYLLSLGIKPKEDINKVFEKLSLNEAAEYYRTNYGVKLSTEQIICGINEMIKEFYRTKVTLKNCIAEYLEYLSGKKVKMCIATLTNKEIVKETLHRLGVSEYFPEVFTCLQTGKTEPDIYRTALLHLGTKKEETCVFEDAFYAAETAKKDGFSVVGIYDKYERNQEKMMSVCDMYISGFNETRLYTIQPKGVIL